MSDDRKLWLGQIVALALVLVLSFSNCSRPASFKAVYDRSVKLQREGNAAASLNEIDQALPKAAGKSAEWYWKLYFLKVRIVQDKEGPKQALLLLRKEPPDLKGLGSARAQHKFHFGWAQATLAEYAQARKTLDQSLALAKAANDAELIPSIELAQAQVLQHERLFPVAEELTRDASERARLLGKQDQYIYGLDLLGLLLLDQFRFEDALSQFEQELERLRVTDNTRQKATALNNAAWCRYRLGEEERALRLFERAIDLARQSHSAHVEHVALGNAGNIYFNRRNYNAARKMWEEALEVAKSRSDKVFTAHWLSNLAGVAIETKDWNRAADYSSRALALYQDLNDKTGELRSLVHTARITEGRGDVATAARQLAQIANTPSEDHLPKLDAHRWLAQLYANQGQDAKADAEFESALEIIEQRRSSFRADEIKMDFLSNLMHVHEDYVDFLMARGKTERALEVAEASRARILQERAGQTGATRTVSASVYRRIARETGASLLSYWLGPIRSYVWVTTPENTIAYTLASQDKIRGFVENYRAFIENLRDPMETDDLSGRELYEALLAPVISRLPHSPNLIIVPDGALNALNFETLVVPTPKKHYFIDDAIIAVVPSLNLLTYSSRPANSNRMLLIGDPEFSDARYSKLPYAAHEMQLIEKRFPASGVTAYQGARAVPAAYGEAADFRYVHFTAHAKSDAESPLDSAILLAGSNGASQLTARDVMKLPLHGGLVTISACRGAGAKTYAGEGLVGFMWAFYQAGAGNVIAGLWDVSDESTPMLMDSLYARLTRGEAPAAALRAAKLDLLHSNANFRLPYYWAPFQLYARDIAR